MSFLQDNKNIGLLLLILGIMSIIAPLALFMYKFSTAYVIVMVIGGIISGLVFILAGLSVRDSKDDPLGLLQLFAGIMGLKISYDIKIGIPALLILVFGITFIFQGIFAIVAGAVNHAIGVSLGTAIIFIIVGIFFLISAPIVAGNKKSSAGNVIWIILLIMIILGLLVAILTAIGGFFWPIYGLCMLIYGICLLLLIIFLLLAILSPEIKKNMGVD